jgi:hypothetical protein
MILEQRKAAEVWRVSSRGKITFGDARKIYETNLASNQRLKPSAKVYRNITIKDLCKTWPGLDATDIRKITRRDCVEGAARSGQKYSPSLYNNTVGTLRRILENGVSCL